MLDCVRCNVCKQELMSAFQKLIRMNKYLSDVKCLGKGLTKRPLLVVMGNESVDLDSAVSSICFAYHLSNLSTISHTIPESKRDRKMVVVPAINATRLELPLKTEVTHWLKKHQIDLENLVCRDEINLSEDVDSFALVDHHVSPYRENVVSVLDHRPFDEISNLNSDCFVNIQEVGSCATLVCDAIKKDVDLSRINSDYIEALRLCYGSVVLDTINFSKEADKVRPLDIEIGEFIESILNIEDASKVRKETFDELVAARADVSSLDSLQILSKDLKIISSDDGKVKVAIPGVAVFDYIEMNKAKDNVRKFAQLNNIDVVVLMGMMPVGDSIERHLGVINIKHEALFAGVCCTISLNHTCLIENSFRSSKR